MTQRKYSGKVKIGDPFILSGVEFKVTKFLTRVKIEGENNDPFVKEPKTVTTFIRKCFFFHDNK